MVLKGLIETIAINASSGQVVTTIGIWILAIVCIPIMKKLEPDNKIYPVWALFIALMFTAFALYNWLS